MKICDLDTPTVSEVLDVLSVAAASRSIIPTERVLISATNHCPSEGLALLTAYTSIADPTIRQAFLDLALMLAAETT